MLRAADDELISSATIRCQEAELDGLMNPPQSDVAITVPLLDLSPQYLAIKDEINEAIRRVVESQRFILGPEVEALENEIAQYCGCKYAVGVSSGTDALLMSLMCLGVSRGDEVITAPFTFFATIGSIMRVGATVALADIQPETFNIDPAHVRKLITKKTKAIIPIHLFGQCADMEILSKIADENNIPLIEDAAQAIGAEFNGRRAGNMGTFGCFSFYPSKNLGAFGDAGIITCNDAHLAERLRIIRNQGTEQRYNHTLLGGNFRLDAVQAAVLRVKLKYLETWTEQRRANAAYYTEQFSDLESAGVVVPPRIVHGRHVFNQYVIRAENRDGLRSFLKANRIDTEIYYPKPMHLQECFSNGNYKEGDFPVTEEACTRSLALPIYPELQENQKYYVVSKIREFYSK